MLRLLLLLLLLIALPAYAEAAVTINEVAWMGDTTSANHEWIEIFNSGEAAVSVDGWILSDGLNLSVTLAGTLAANQYGVLERTGEESAPGTAFLIYTGALVNTGATLTLRDGGGTIQDQVPGGEEWQNIGGDNTTKDTAQYTDRGWITAPGTPGRTNASAGTVVNDNDDDDDDAAPATPARPASKSKTTNATVLVRNQESGLDTRIVAPAQVYVNQPVEFTLDMQGAGPTIISSLKHVWNFGDMETASGTKVTHAYSYPGTYMVTARSIFAKNDVLARLEVTVLPVKVSLGRTPALDITLNNDSPYELDISGYIVKGTKELVIPPGTYLLERGTITIPRHRLELDGVQSLIMIYDATRQLVTSSLTAEARAVTSEPEPIVMAMPAEPIYIASPAQDFAELPTPSLLMAETAYAENPAAEVLFSPASTEEPYQVPERWPYAALIILIGAALLVIFRSPRATLDRDSTTS
jgi:Lamin Tail Domain/PKD domain